MLNLAQRGIPFLLLTAAVACPAEAQTPPPVAKICSPCHGLDGRGGDVEKPNLAGQKSIYLRQQLAAFRSGTRKHPDMKYLSRKLTDREIDALVSYYSMLPE